MQSDSALFKRWQKNGDRSAFTTLAHRHATLITDVAYRIGGDRQTAEDALQDSLLALAQEASARPVEVGIRAWLARAAISKAKNARASQGSRKRRERTVGLLQSERAMSNQREAEQGMAERVLESLRGDDASTLTLRFLHQVPYSELAAILGVSEGAARVRVSRALERARASHDDAPSDERKLGAIIASAHAFTLPSASVEHAIQCATKRAIQVHTTTRTISIAKPLVVLGAIFALVTAGAIAWPRSDKVHPVESASNDSTPRERQPTLSVSLRTKGETLAANPTASPRAKVASKGPPEAESSKPEHASRGSVARRRPQLVKTRLHMRLQLDDGLLEDVRIVRVRFKGIEFDTKNHPAMLQTLSVAAGWKIFIESDDPRVATPVVLFRVPNPVPAALDVTVFPQDAPNLDELTLEVVDAQTGDPLPNATIHWGEGEGNLTRQHTNAQGRIEIRDLQRKPNYKKNNSALVHFTAAEYVISAPGYLHAGHTFDGKEFVPSPLVEHRHLTQWVKDRMIRVELQRISEHAGIVERSVRLVDSQGRPCSDACLYIGRPYTRDQPLLVNALLKDSELRRCSADGVAEFPMGSVAVLSLRVRGVFVAAWGIAANAWQDEGPREFSLPPIAHASVHVTGVPGNSIPSIWRHGPRESHAAMHPLLEDSMDAAVTSMLKKQNAMLPLWDRLPRTKLKGEVRVKFPLATGHKQTWHVSNGKEVRVLTLHTNVPGDYKVVRRWEDLPLKTK